MLGYYHLSLQGISHQTAGVTCQDASEIVKLENGWVVAAVADGLGSCKYSDIGSTNAVSAVIAYLSENMVAEWNVDSLCVILKEAYESAVSVITEIAQSKNHSVRDYDTTLTTAIYNGRQVVYAHVGDGGIVLLQEDGQYAQLTEVQKGEAFNAVAPLRNEKSWAFGASGEDVCAFSMFTDGIYDVVCPWLLASENQKIYINYVRPFMDMNLIMANSEEDFLVLQENAAAFLLSDYHENITDDKTIAVVVNTDIIPELQPEEYYFEPDWEALQNEKRKKLYNADPIAE